MQRLTDVVSTKAYLRSRQQHGLRIGLVPTMGALHEGHLSLVRAARTRADIVVASVFVNPKQFGPNEDLDRYPRDLEGDMDKLASVGVDVLFAPTVDAMYPPGFHCTVSVAGPTEGLEGGVRPGHFDGVTTVVLKLFTIVRPDVAVFGEKDYQQLVTLKKMARDLDLDVEVAGAPLIREPDGLAMSSRNRYLSNEERQQARSLSVGLSAAQTAYRNGERDGARLLALVRAALTAAGIQPEYLELRHADDLSALERADRPSVILLAALVGTTRLLDNVILR